MFSRTHLLFIPVSKGTQSKMKAGRLFFIFLYVYPSLWTTAYLCNTVTFIAQGLSLWELATPRLSHSLTAEGTKVRKRTARPLTLPSLHNA